MDSQPVTPNPSHRTRVLCVDDSPDMTAVMRMIIDAEPTMRCVGCLASADHMIDAIRRTTPPPDVVILDATMPGKNSFDAMRELAAEFPAIKTIIYSGHDDPAFVERAVDAGAWGCISKREDANAILRAVRAAAAGKRLVPPPPPDIGIERSAESQP